MNGEPRIKFDTTINLGHIITIVLLILSVTIAWVKLDSRVSKLEQWQVVIDNQVAVQNQLVDTLKLLNQRLTDYPLHKHVGNVIVYPGTEPSTDIPEAAKPQ